VEGVVNPFVVQLNDEGTYHLNVQPDAAAATRLAAGAVVFWSKKAIGRRGRFHVALSGGSTPRALYALLATPELAAQIFWDRVHVWWGDERDVPSDHADSNYKLAHDALLSKVPIPLANIHRVRTELGAAQAAAQYETEIKHVFERLRRDEATGAVFDMGGWPVFDLVLLGMGDDGHTASLFPHSAALKADEQLVAAHYVEKVGMQRITFTAPLINAADTVIFLVTGAGKASMLKRVLLGDYTPDELPSQLIAPLGKLFWMADAAAAAEVAPHAGYPAGEFIYRRAA
jgi:6-phosphogluconolactonase